VRASNIITVSQGSKPKKLLRDLPLKVLANNAIVAPVTIIKCLLFGKNACNAITIMALQIIKIVKVSIEI